MGSSWSTGQRRPCHVLNCRASSPCAAAESSHARSHPPPCWLRRPSVSDCRISSPCAAVESSQIFGKPVRHLGEATKVLATAPSFLPCAARKILDNVVGTDAATTIDRALLERIAAAATARARNGEPTFQDLVIATFSDPVVVHSVLSRPTR